MGRFCQGRPRCLLFRGLQRQAASQRLGSPLRAAGAEGCPVSQKYKACMHGRKPCMNLLAHSDAGHYWTRAECSCFPRCITCISASRCKTLQQHVLLRSQPPDVLLAGCSSLWPVAAQLAGERTAASLGYTAGLQLGVLLLGAQAP